MCKNFNKATKGNPWFLDGRTLDRRRFYSLTSFLLLKPGHPIFHISFKMIEMNGQICVSSLSVIALRINPSPCAVALSF